MLIFSSLLVVGCKITCDCQHPGGEGKPGTLSNFSNLANRSRPGMHAKEIAIGFFSQVHAGAPGEQPQSQSVICSGAYRALAGSSTLAATTHR